MLRALRFMDSMIQRDTMQKAAFLNDLTTFWHKFDDRVLRLKVCHTSSLHTGVILLFPRRRPSARANLLSTSACRISTIQSHAVTLYAVPVGWLSVCCTVL